MANKRFKTPKKASSRGHIFDAFHKDVTCKIPATTGQPRLDPMDMLRPAPFTAKEYDINQTYAIMDRGPVKVRYTDTHGTYDWQPDGFKPPPPKVKKGHGRSGLEFLLEEEWAMEIERMQADARARLVVVARERKKKNKKELFSAQENLLKLAGPAWYQDLSNEQRSTADNLARCIVMDLRSGSICHTQENLGRLGLVLRPNSEQIKIALYESCRCPIEFLQVLYQVTNLGRTEYSVNDKIILSAIVHLAIRDTLKELHIRIPSPPRCKPKIKKVQTPRYIRPISPYLDTFIFTPIPRKKFRMPTQYPQNEYFDYIRQLRENAIWLCTDRGDELNESLNMVNKFLMSGCEEEVEEEEELDPFTIIEQELVAEWLHAQQLYNKLAVGDCIRALDKPSVYIPCINRFSRLGQNQSKKPVGKKEGSFNATTDSSSSSSTSSSDGIQCVYTGPTCKLAPDYYDCHDCGCEYPGECLDGESVVVEAPEDPEETQIANTIYPCEFDNGPKYNLLEPKLDDSLQCVCRQKTIDGITNAHCQCERCVADREAANSKKTKIIVDTVEQDGEAVKVIGGIKSEKICKCLETYQKRWTLWEKRRQIKKAQEAIRSLREKFIITGVATGPDGKAIYILGGIKPKHECPCYHIEEYNEAQQKQQAQTAPPLPEGCIQYVVSGVKARPEGNVYVISGTTPNPDYICADLYRNFANNHSVCMRLYEEYMKKIQYELEEYMNEMNPDYQDFKAQESEDPKPEEPPICECVCRCDQSLIKCDLYPKPEVEQEEESLCYPEAETGLDCTCSQYEQVSSSTESCECNDLENDGKNNNDKSKSKRKSEEAYELSRYIILKQFPNDVGIQFVILKKALSKLADDGFPLAKLPDAYQLPHFKLWLQMRAKKYWTAGDKAQYNRLTRYYADQSDKLFNPAPQPKPTFLANQYDKFNWNYRDYIKSNNERITMQYERLIKETCINDTKMFYPVCFPYEFPSRYFRDVFFAYLPAKMESIYPFRPWKMHEVKEMNIKSRRHC